MLLSASLLVALAAASQDPPYTLRVDVPLVTVDVTVSDADGRPVTDLAREDFLIYEDGKQQDIQTFSPVDSPYSILLLIDRSRSMERHWPLMEPAVGRFLSILKPQDRVSIAAFDERSKDVELLLDWRDVRNESSIEVAINPLTRGNPYYRAATAGSSRPASNGMGPGGMSVVSIRVPSKDVYIALDWARRRIVEVPGRKGVIVLTDGRPPESRTKVVSVDGRLYVQPVDPKDDDDFQKLLRAVQAARIRFDFIAIGTDLNPAAGNFSPDPEMALNLGMSVRLRLELLASKSGGRVAFPRRPEDTIGLYEDIAQKLGRSYALGYSPSAASLKDGAHHRIEVRTRRDGLAIEQSRDGFSTR